MAMHKNKLCGRQGGLVKSGLANTDAGTIAGVWYAAYWSKD